MTVFEERLQRIKSEKERLTGTRNEKLGSGDGFCERYKLPVLTAAHVPLFWEYDLNPASNPYFMKRFGINAVFNAGAIRLGGKYLLVVRVEGYDRKSFFAVAESDTGMDGFQFWKYPLEMPETTEPDVNIYDMRLTAHEDGWIYGLFCTERKDPAAAPGNESQAVAQCGIARTHDLHTWERLADLQTPSPQQRNVVLHPEFIDGQYAFYTRPQDSFIEAGRGGGIALGLAPCIENAQITRETVIDARKYHTVYESKNGQGPAPIKTRLGWLHLAHGVRHTAAGLRYVLYLFMTDLADPAKVIYKPAGYFLAPEGIERVGDVSNVVFSNGWIVDDNGAVFIYYGSSDTRLHVATTTVERLLDYITRTPPESFNSLSSRNTLSGLIDRNLAFLSAGHMESSTAFNIPR
ncbi:4-O-beta-D-mannosyl-D-glucose phosphorylase [Dyadobacter sp. SG02]|uniref:glycoside hydrolase family 130 protein n=1 Tax=Dyadobacter sp. SG02 TaxID=1855291 RepID=UPI0008B89492|nr:glycosidase [Dyadobacter sp. SG02]SEJ42966.1 4-O-beta-D-mannosyl-D-glucose phosphorylase [Dyadobacter sp. SG02]